MDCSKIINENCGVIREIPISVTELHITTQNVDQSRTGTAPSVTIELGNIGLYVVEKLISQLK